MMSDSIGPVKPLKWYKRLATRKGRDEAGAFLVEGERATSQLVKHYPGRILEVVTTSSKRPPPGSFPHRVVDERQFHSISQTRTPQGIMTVVRLPSDITQVALPDHPGRKILLLENIRDPGNVGTLIRTAAGFDYDGIILSDRCADPFSPKCVQATAGSVLSLWIRRTRAYVKLGRDLIQDGFTLVAADMRGNIDPSVLGSHDKLALVLGSEAEGLSPEMLQIADITIRIPMDREKAESLNVAACGAICMYLSSAGKGE